MTGSKQPKLGRPISAGDISENFFHNLYNLYKTDGYANSREKAEIRKAGTPVGAEKAVKLKLKLGKQKAEILAKTQRMGKSYVKLEKWQHPLHR